ncbi:MAG: AAA family ATPase, partial [Verrucomicrobia bacterium]|nr:AAA family ATPase [Verrucomicrobiota bacterium]
MKGNVVLYGFKGCGKSYFGKLLAKESGYTFIDTDQLIEELHGDGSCRDIALKQGEPFFRELERRVIASLPQAENRVIAVGGGAVLDAQTTAKLRQLGTLVYLIVE